MNTPRHRLWISVLILAVGLLQALDSGLATASATVLPMIAAGVLAPALAALSGRRAVHGLAVVISAAALIGARTIATMPGLLVLLPFYVFALFASEQLDQRRATGMA